MAQYLDISGNRYGMLTASNKKPIGGEYIGSYDTAQQAHNTYMLEATKKYGDFLYQDGNNLVSDNQYAEKIS